MRIKPLNITLICLLAIFALSISLTPLRSDNDAWWHLKTGKILADRGWKLPQNDVFAFTSEDIPWHNHEWLTEVLFFYFFQMGDGTDQGGVRMVVIFKGAILLLTSLLIFWFSFRETKSVPISVLCAIWAMLLARRTVYPRPPIMSYLFFAGYLFLLRECFTGRISKRWLWVLPFAMIPWVNLHGGFILGIIAIGTYVSADVIKDIIQRKSPFHRDMVMKAGLLFACILASLVNPYTYRLYLLPGRVMTDVGLVRIIPELRSPDFFFTKSFEALLIFLIIVFAVMKKNILSLAEGFLLIFFLHQGIQHVRHVPLAGIVAAPVCARLFSSLQEDYLPSRWKKAAFYGWSVLVIFLFFLTLMSRREGESFLDRNRNLLKGIGFYERNYPAPEANFIIANQFTGRMYNQINDAGYLIWRLSPEHHKVFTDSRYDIFGGTFMRHEQIIQGGIDRKIYPQDKTWDELLEFWNVNFILITADAPVNPLLQDSGTWRLVYHRLPRYAKTTREGYKIYIRNIPENKDLIERCLRSSRFVTPGAS
ncbi:hypothetical protein JW926_04735 [Candidatus Sumerlaeota bacterium]|nr:hypothetical protein [Candidatus Sumerlaeota bacterium]